MLSTTPILFCPGVDAFTQWVEPSFGLWEVVSPKEIVLFFLLLSIITFSLNINIIFTWVPKVYHVVVCKHA